MESKRGRKRLVPTMVSIYVTECLGVRAKSRSRGWAQRAKSTLASRETHAIADVDA